MAALLLLCTGGAGHMITLVILNTLFTFSMLINQLYISSLSLIGISDPFGEHAIVAEVSSFSQKSSPSEELF